MQAARDAWHARHDGRDLRLRRVRPGPSGADSLRRRRRVQLRRIPRRRVVIDHVTVGVSDLERSREFFSRALVPLGLSQIGDPRNEGREIEFGLEKAPNFAISTAYPTGAPVHVAFAADRREQVDAFHAEALAAGGRKTARPGSDPSTPMTTTGLSCLTPTATTSRRCAAASRAARLPVARISSDREHPRQRVHAAADAALVIACLHVALRSVKFAAHHYIPGAWVVVRVHQPSIKPGVRHAAGPVVQVQTLDL